MVTEKNLLLDGTGEGVIPSRPATVLPIETYTPERIAEFERDSDIDEDTRAAVREALSRVGG
jgi:hypothetical protein